MNRGVDRVKGKGRRVKVDSPSTLTLQPSTSLRVGDTVKTSLFGAVTISEVYASEAEARAAGYVFDAAAYIRNAFGGREAPKYKVLARWTDFVHKEYCVVTDEGDPSARPENEGGPAQDDKDGRIWL